VEGHTSNVRALAVLPDGRLASGSFDKTVRVWHLSTGVCEAILEGHTELVSAHAVPPGLPAPCPLPPSESSQTAQVVGA